VIVAALALAAVFAVAFVARGAVVSRATARRQAAHGVAWPYTPELAHAAEDQN
jgi:hypothetical protein